MSFAKLVRFQMFVCQDPKMDIFQVTILSRNSQSDRSETIGSGGARLIYLESFHLSHIFRFVAIGGFFKIGLSEMSNFGRPLLVADWSDRKTTKPLEFAQGYNVSKAHPSRFGTN